MAKIYTPCRLDPEAKNYLIKKSENTGRSISWLINSIVLKEKAKEDQEKKQNNA